jgi:hypothetical protein
VGSHDAYGKELLARACGPAYEQYGPALEVDFGAGHPGRIDGVVGGRIAVEVDSRTAKQVRGAVLDLLCHRLKKKLLVLVPAHMSDASAAAAQCRNIMSRFLSAADFRVVVLQGTGASPSWEADIASVRNAVADLG